MNPHSNNRKKRSYFVFSSTTTCQEEDQIATPATTPMKKTTTVTKTVPLTTQTPAPKPSRELSLNHLLGMVAQEVSYRLPIDHVETILSALQQEGQQRLGDEVGESEPKQTLLTQPEVMRYLRWRRPMVVWIYRMAEACKFSMESAEIATLLLDRYVSTNPVLMLDSSGYQLSCMACLYTVCKINEPICVSSKQMERLSGSMYTFEQIQVAEFAILQALEWKMNPPTSIAFARALLDTVPNLEEEFGITDNHKQGILISVEIQVQHAMAEELFLPILASEIALAAVFNAMTIELSPHMSMECLLKLEGYLLTALGYSHVRPNKIRMIQESLLAVMAGYDVCHPLVVAAGKTPKNSYFKVRCKPNNLKATMAGKKVKPSTMDPDSCFRERSPRSVLLGRKQYVKED